MSYYRLFVLAMDGGKLADIIEALYDSGNDDLAEQLRKAVLSAQQKQAVSIHNCYTCRNNRCDKCRLASMNCEEYNSGAAQEGVTA